MSSDNVDYIQLIKEKIGYEFKEEHSDLIQQAFVRRSYSNEEGGENNEILEFIGDVVLSYYVTKIICDEYGRLMDEISTNYEWNEFAIDADENSLTQIRKKFIEGKFLAKRIDTLELAKHLIMGRGDRKNHADKQSSVKEGLFEAILGAIAIDSGWNSDKLEKAVVNMLDIYSHLGENGFAENDGYVIRLESWSYKKYGIEPSYNIQKTFNGYSGTVRIKTSKGLQNFSASGSTECETRMNLARNAYIHLKNAGELSNAWDDVDIDNLTRENAINKLQELYQKGYCSEPEYIISDEEIYDNGNIWWKCKCIVNNCRVEERTSSQNPLYIGFYSRFSSNPIVGEIFATSKKYSKKCAAYSVLCKIFNIEEEDDN